MVKGRSKNLGDINPKVKPRRDPLSEDEELACEKEPEAGEFGSVAPDDGVGLALGKLTSILQLLTDEKKSKVAGSKLGAALDAHPGSSSDGPLHGVGKRAAATRRALRAAYEDHPEEISSLIEKLMYEDLHSTTLGPGMKSPGLNARAWVEFRSKIGNYKTSAHSAWIISGILDSLISGNIPKARARACVGLLQLDQASCDKGSWVLAAELGLEGLPPFTSLSQHSPPSIHDGEAPYSKLLDTRWGEQAVAFLKEQDDYVVRRSNLNKQSRAAKADDFPDAEKSRRAKAKAKAKSQSAAAPSDP